jgi:hypothetical protein
MDIEVWLVNKGSGTLFVSWLDLRPLKITLYQVNPSKLLVLRDTVL